MLTIFDHTNRLPGEAAQHSRAAQEENDMTPPDLRTTEAFANFLRLSAQIGNDILKTQGAGGNTSIKSDGVMWVKASGTWLANAATQDIMVPVFVEPLVKALRDRDGRAETSTDFVVEALNTSRLRPSIETSFHAALQSPVVAHYHCVNTISLAVLENREAVLADRMARVPDLKWVSIPYRRPGTPLAREIDKAAESKPDVLILHNHGIVVCGDTVEEVAERIGRVTEALFVTPRATGEQDVAALFLASSGSGYHPAEDPCSHAPALQTVNQDFALGGSMYPDHVIFLGTEIGTLEDGQTAADLEALRRTEGREAPKVLIVRGKGVLLSNSLTAGGEVMARCLAEVAGRIIAGERVAYLTPDDEYELTHWEAEIYRQALDRKSAGQPA
jgi:rhamnose utilization protein RhaD (predicted bifunctional aldolase and dehydrogenase)